MDKNNEMQKLEKIIDELIINRTIPESYPDVFDYRKNFGKENFSYDFKNIDRLYQLRDIMIKYNGFSLVSYDWVRLLKELIIKDGKCLEIMCGTGMLSKALQDVGVDGIATDNNSWAKDEFIDNDWIEKPFTQIEEIDCIEAIKKYGKEIDFVIVSWAYMDDTCYRALITMREVNPDCKMIFIGEYGDACANDDFVYNAICLNNTTEYNEAMGKINNKFLSWNGIHDRVYIVK